MTPHARRETHVADCRDAARGIARYGPSLMAISSANVGGNSLALEREQLGSYHGCRRTSRCLPEAVEDGRSPKLIGVRERRTGPNFFRSNQQTKFAA